jgi:hypothetical protein
VSCFGIKHIRVNLWSQFSFIFFFWLIWRRSQRLDCVTSNGMIIDELEGIWKGAVMWAPSICLEGLRRTTKNLSQGGRSPGCEPRSIHQCVRFYFVYIFIFFRLVLSNTNKNVEGKKERITNLGVKTPFLANCSPSFVTQTVQEATAQDAWWTLLW